MREALLADRIESNLNRLRLPRIRDILERTIASAEQNGSSYLSFLDEL